MVAVEPNTIATNIEYQSLFNRYIATSINALYARIAPNLQELSAEGREQAWHLLDYGLKAPEGWRIVHKLLLALAPEMERWGFRADWLHFLERGVVASQQADDRAGEARLSLYVGRIYRLMGELAQAQSWLLASAELCKQVDEPRGRALALNQLAYVARRQSRYPEARAYVEEAQSLLADGDEEHATSHWVLGNIAIDELDWAAAEHHHRAALQIWQETGNQQRAAWSLQNLGEAMRGAGRNAEAVAPIQQAIALLGKLHDPVNQAIARMSLGMVLDNLGRGDEAVAIYQLAEPVFRRAQDHIHLAMLNNNVAYLQRGLGHLPEAERAALRGVHLWEVLGDAKSLANTLDELGLVYLAQKRYADAAATFVRGLEFLSEVPPGPMPTMLREMLSEHLAEAQAEGNA